MIKLVNGRGQIGTAMEEKIHLYDISNKDIFVYHTWNIDDKTKQVQKLEYDKFKTFVDQYKDKNIAFISTYSQKDNWYNYYKQLSEAYLLLKCEHSKIIKLPTLIGKGIFIKAKEGLASPYGTMQIMSVEKAVERIFDIIKLENNINRVYNIQGELIKAETMFEVLKI